jgi:hypothetical protein
VEPLSPELVLIDPDLARRERARLLDQAHLAGLAVRREAPPIDHRTAKDSNVRSSRWRRPLTERVVNGLAEIAWIGAVLGLVVLIESFAR